MTLTLDLSPELETRLSIQAAQLHLPLEEYAIRLLAAPRIEAIANPPVQNGAQLLVYWQQQGLIGSRTEEIDSPEYARSLRSRAEKRVTEGA